MKHLKLYRGVSAEDFELLSRSKFLASRTGWKEVLENRAAGNFRYPKELDSLVLELQRISRLERQYFTDDRRVALSYARKTNGILVEICVPLSDLLKFFRLEFQNFSSRKKKFEIVYAVEAQVLARRRTFWGLKTKRLR